ncbi:MAG: GGDEF domain-containing protein [Planctomycetota bacterium]|nr:MAG: GGDEF domain-containing protein [Planctomycetota bacterium]
MVVEELLSGSGNRRILLIGDINRAFSDAEVVHRLPCEIQANMLDAIDIVARENFVVIGVVMSGSLGSLSSALKALRQVNSDARIILLARMHEEPLAIQLVGSASNGATLADDYLICPIRANRFYEFIEPGYRVRKASVATSAVVDAVTEAKIKQLEKLATEDDLTSLKNRRYIWEFSRQIIERSRKRNEQVTLLIFDIDNFKHYNDVYGHLAGDEILKQAAVLMRRCCRQHDVVGRIGGDEFAVIFWDDPHRKALKEEAERRSALAEHPKAAIFIAKRFRKELEKTELHLLGPKGRGVLTISGGLASFPRDGSTVGELFSQADTALLDAKRSGKNRIYLVGKPQSDIADVG